MANEEEKTLAPDFWNNSQAAEQVMQYIRAKKQWLIDFDDAATAVEELETIYEFYKEEAATDEDLNGAYTAAERQIEKVGVQKHAF